jgi:E-phenylitaconyl-CoA hydratase
VLQEKIIMPLLYEKKRKVAIITLNRPEALNALDPESYKEFSDACIDIRDDQNVWVAIITGAGEKAFCVGADLKKSIPRLLEGNLEVPASIRRGLQIYKPFIAAINGIAGGGGLEIALACDIRLAAEQATFTVAEARWSLMPGQGGTQRLPRIVGPAKAAELMFMSGTIDSFEAYRIGLVNKVVAYRELMPTALDWAERICQNGPLAVRAIKQAMIQGLDSTLEEGLQLEESLMNILIRSEDSKEGLKAFTEKRKPIYMGR